ncbi:MAG: LytTR family DNA-binding domain-containing protein [Bacteroidota bacterium]
MNLKAVIIEDEEKSRIGLQNLVEDYCHDIQVMATAEDVPKGVKAIVKHKPDVIFLDIEMPQHNGFELFEFFTEPDFEVIFTTAYDQFAVKAFKMSAVDYLLKPIDLGELRAAIEKAREKRINQHSLEHLALLKDNMSDSRSDRVALPTQEGYLFVSLHDIVRMEADGNYTKFHLGNEKQILVSKTMKEFEKLFQGNNFFRAHRSHLVNLEWVSKYTRAKAPTLTMKDGTEITLSPSKREAFLQSMLGL